MRYFFEISYNGAKYHGWQNQANAIGVQQIVEDSLTKLLREKIAIVASGRTDTGVHCKSQFFHTDISNPFDTTDLIHRLNSFLPKDIAIKNIFKVMPDAHARYSAYERAYIYKITLAKDPLITGLAYYYFKPLNISKMNKAASLLRGEHDFECFSKVKTDVDHFVCDIKKAKWEQDGDLLSFHITANRFLRGMVRAIVGTLLDVGTGKLSIDDFKAILKSKDRRKAGMNAPPEGLYLVHVKYPKKIFVK